MPPPIPVILDPYNVDWPALARDYTEKLLILGHVLITTHHIGSTSVPGLAAKPIIDLIPEVRSLEEVDEKRCLIEKLGYEWHGEYGFEGRRYCTFASESGTRLAQLHIYETGSPQIIRHLAFRDYLRAHPHVADDYGREKERARAIYPDNSHAYTDEKSAWIKRVESEALAWAAHR